MQKEKFKRSRTSTKPMHKEMCSVILLSDRILLDKLKRRTFNMHYCSVHTNDTKYKKKIYELYSTLDNTKMLYKLQKIVIIKRDLNARSKLASILRSCNKCRRNWLQWCTANNQITAHMVSRALKTLVDMEKKEIWTTKLNT